MIAATDWLPADTPVPPALDRLVGETVSAWSAAWFAVAQPITSSLSRRAICDVAWRSLDKGVMLGLGSDAMVAIGAAALDLPHADRREPDRAMIESIAEECVADLRKRLAGVVAQAPNAGWKPGAISPSHCATITFSGRSSIAIGLSEAAFARAAKEALPAAPDTPFGDGATALAATPITVGATIGGAILSLAELEALGVGDVVVLDQPIDQPARLTVDGVSLPAGRCSVSAASPSPFLQILEPVAQRVLCD